MCRGERRRPAAFGDYFFCECDARSSRCHCGPFGTRSHFPQTEERVGIEWEDQGHGLFGQ